MVVRSIKVITGRLKRVELIVAREELRSMGSGKDRRMVGGDGENGCATNAWNHSRFQEPGCACPHASWYWTRQIAKQ